MTVKDRLPVTITKAIDFLTRNRNELIKRFSGSAGEERDLVIEELKQAIERLSELRYELVTDKQLRPVGDSFVDADHWNRLLEKLRSSEGDDDCTWFRAPWLFTECYMYRRIHEAMRLCKSALRGYDPFEQAKIESHELSLANMSGIIKILCPLDYEQEEKDAQVQMSRFKMIVQAQLWANKNDLSLSSGEDVSSKVKNLVSLIDSLQSNVLCDHLDELWQFLLKLNEDRKEEKKKKIRIDIALDNCAIELTADLILCDFLLRNNLADQICLHGKLFSWFISDVSRI